MKRITIALLLCMGIARLSSPVHAELIYGIDESSGQTLVSWDSANPSALLGGFPISGLQTNETIKGIDFRPSTRELYALGSSKRLYTLDTATGVATEVPPPGPFTPALNGSVFGFDFNPVIDMIRVVSNTGRNYVLNPNDGSATQVTNLFYGPSDPNFGVTPNVVSSAYTPPSPGTQLYGIDSNLNILVTQANSDGTLATVGPLNVDIVATGGFDISSLTGIAYAAMQPANSAQSFLYSIDLLTGNATNLGAIDGGVIISSMAIAVIPEPSTIVLMSLAVCALGGRKRCHT